MPLGLRVRWCLRDCVLISRSVVHSGVVHPNIVPLKGFTMEPCCCIVTEFMEGGNLWDFIKSEASGIFYATTPHTHARH